MIHRPSSTFMVAKITGGTLMGGRSVRGSLMIMKEYVTSVLTELNQESKTRLFVVIEEKSYWNSRHMLNMNKVSMASELPGNLAGGTVESIKSKKSCLFPARRLLRLDIQA
jgi:hypothetical protein